MVACTPHPLTGFSEGVSSDGKCDARIDADAGEINEVPSIEYLTRVDEAFGFGELAVRDCNAVEGIPVEQAGLVAISGEHVPPLGIRTTIIRGNPYNLPGEVGRQGL